MNASDWMRLLVTVDENLRISNELCDQWEREGHSLELEPAWNEAYQNYWTAVNELIDAICTSLPDTDRATATQMALHEQQELTAIILEADPSAADVLEELSEPETAQDLSM